MRTVKSLVSRFVKGEEGVSLLEYGLLAALIAVVCIIAISNLGTNVKDTLNNVGTQMTAQGVQTVAPTP